jgi:ABC-2 type transport system ATP-binding protein
MKTLVEVKNLFKVYEGGKGKKKTIANEDLSFTVNEGECVGILGPNGCGKTTLVRQLIGYLPMTSGEIKIFGKTYKINGTEIRRLLAYMMQNRYSHWDHLTVWQALFYAGQLKGMPKKDIETEAERFIEKFELKKYRNCMIQILSGGNKQATSLAITLMGKPRLIILDEPSSGLDPIKRMQLWDLLNQINKENNASILIVSHNPIEIERVANQVMILDKGKIIEHGSLDEIKKKLIGETRIEIEMVPNSNMGEIIKQLNQFNPIYENEKVLFHCEKTQLPKIIEQLTQLNDWKNIKDFGIVNPSLEDIYIKALRSKME